MGIVSDHYNIRCTSLIPHWEWVTSCPGVLNNSLKNPHPVEILARELMLLHCAPRPLGASLVAQLVKNLPAMQETWVQFLGWEDPLEKEMATHSTILAWRIPWTEEPGGL